MPLTSKINLEVGARTWRFNSDDPVSGGVPKRGGYFETAPRNGRTKPKPSPTVSSTARSLPAPTQTAPKPASIIQAPPRDPGPSEEEARIELEKRILAEEKLKIEEMNRQAQQTLEHAEMIRQKVTEAQELNAIAAQREAEQRILHQQEIEEEKQQLLFEAERKLQQLREEVAVVQQKYEAELSLWKERQERTLALESEAEARAKAREAAEEARASQRERELIQERAEALERLKQEAIEEYKRTHEELRRAQEEQLRKELEDARQKIVEESAARKASLEAEREATILKLREEARLEYQKQLDSHHQLGKETAEALKEASAKAAEEFKAQSQEALKSLRSIAGDSYPRSERSVPQKSSAGKPSPPNPASDCKATSPQEAESAKPTPAQSQPNLTDEELLKKREAMRQRLLLGVYTPSVNRIHEWGIRSAPAPFPAVPSPSTWGSPANRQRANSVGQVNLTTPFIPGSAMVPHLNPQQIAPLRGGYKHDLYSRPVNPHPTRGDLYCNPSTAQTVNRMAAIVHASPAPLPGSSHIPGDSWTAAPTNKSNKSTKTPHQSQHTDVVKPQLHSKVEHALQFTGGSKGMYHDYDDYTPPVTAMSGIRGYTIFEVYGHVDGCVVRDLTKEQNEVTLANDRNKATHRMWQKAERLGATHVIGLKFQNHTMSPFEAAIIASGTAVVMVRSIPTLVPPGPDDTNPEPKVLPSNKPGQAQKGTGPPGESQNAKNKKKGKRNEEGAGQTQDQGVNNGGCGYPSLSTVETSDQGDQDAGNAQTEWVATGWGNEAEDSQKKTKNNGGKKAPQNQPATKSPAGWGDGWGATTEGQDENNDDPSSNTGGWSNDNANNAGGWSKDTSTNKAGGWSKDTSTNGGGWSQDTSTNGGGWSTEPKKGQKGNKANKDGGGEGQKKGNKEKGKQARDNNEGHTSAAPEEDSTQWVKQNKNHQKVDKPTGNPPDTSRSSPAIQFQGGYGYANAGALMVTQPHGDWHPHPSLPPHARIPLGTHRHEYADPRASYPYRSDPAYDQEYWSRRGAVHDYPPMYHNYPSFPMPAPGPLMHYPYERSQRPPMRVEWAAGGDGQSYPTREDPRDAYPDGRSYPFRGQNKPSGSGGNQADRHEWANPTSDPAPNHASWGDSSNGESQAPQNNTKQAPNAKGQAKNQSSKKGGPPPQSEATSCGNEQSTNGWRNGWGNGQSNQQSNGSNQSTNGWGKGQSNQQSSNGGNPNNSEGKKAGGNGAKNAANQPEPQRQKNQNGKSKTRMRSPPPPSSPTTSQGDDDAEAEDGLGIFGNMSANHVHHPHHPTSFTPAHSFISTYYGQHSLHRRMMMGGAAASAAKLGKISHLNNIQEEFSSLEHPDTSLSTVSDLRMHCW
ncbi:hypothetical protein PCANC_07881 [Puccinia coronata f. sp. avenae]|uniref:Uncharacterized protein n=1 Tax=Puccinia coronata f. sp. avenae TaxID=200324 RepID=A0A2N5VCZ8_9BASI|nr:hypothetical protein PCANC_07881 [Puccinia coronata f. sp. avenae]